MNKSELVAIRSILPEDRNFILATFLRGLYYGDSWFTLIPKQSFMEHYHKVIDYLLAKPGVQVKVACLKDTPDVILGYSILSNDTVHFVFVKKNWRGIGIARDLVPNSTKVTTHLTKVGLSILVKKGLTFNPFLV